MNKSLTRELIMAKCRTDNVRMIKKLNLWGNSLNDVGLLNEMTNLEVLSLAVNNITSLKDFGNLVSLQELYLRKNKITNLQEVQYLSQLPRLSVLWLSDNPCSNSANYRKYVIRMLPNLTKLDEHPITSEEREEALESGSKNEPYRRSIPEEDFNRKIDLDDEPEYNHEEPILQQNFRSNQERYSSYQEEQQRNKYQSIQHDYAHPEPIYRSPPKPKINPYLKEKRSASPPQDDKVFENENVVSAILSLIKDLNRSELMFVKKEIKRKLESGSRRY